MFYAHIVLAKKGPLARIWLAAHWDKKITKAHVFETNIEQSVEGIMQPKVKLALRTSGHLLLGVVRIYSRKAKYLLADCNEAFVKIKMAFRPGMVDLPEENREAAVNAITLPEVFHDFDTTLPELNEVDIEEQFSINQSRADEITMREDYGTLPMSIYDDGFGDRGFGIDTPDMARDDLDPNIHESLFAEEMGSEMQQVSKEPMPGTSRSMLDSIDVPPAAMSEDGFGDEEFGQPAAGLFEGDIFADAPLQPTTLPPGAMTSRTESDDDMDHYDGGALSTASSSYNGSRPTSPVPGTSADAKEHHQDPSVLDIPISEMPPIMSPTNIISEENNHAEIDLNVPEHIEEEHEDQSALLNNEEESFALAPVDATALKGVPKTKRKRKLIVDEVKNISGEEMKSQLANTSDIVTTLDLAPPTKRLMYWKETGGVEKLFALPGRDIPARGLSKNYQRHLTSRSFGIEDFSVLGPAEVLALEQNRPEDQESPLSKRGKKRKMLQEVLAQELSLPEPDLAREFEIPVEPTLELEDAVLPLPIISEIPDIPEVEEPIMPPPGTPGMVQMPSPAHPSMLSYSIPMTPGLPMIPELPMTPGFPMTPGVTMTPSIAMTPGNLLHGGMTPIHQSDDDRLPESGLLHEGMGSVDLQHGSMTPGGLDHGGMTPHHGIENMDSIPNLPADQVSSILNGTGMENIGFTNMGFEGPSHSPRGVIANDWTEDYDFPQSVGHQGEEQLENETDEQFEERVLNKRAAQMFITVKNKLNKRESIYLSEMTHRNIKKQAAQKFYSLLVLKKFQAVQIVQHEAYGDILVTRGQMFDNPTL